MADDVMHILGRLEGKMDGFLVTINRHEEALKSLDNRLDTVERDKAKVVGMVSAVSALIGAGGAWMAKKIGLV